MIETEEDPKYATAGFLSFDPPKAVPGLASSSLGAMAIYS